MLIARKLFVSVIVIIVAMLIAAALTEIIFGERRPGFVNILTLAILAYPFFYIWKKK